MKRTNSLAWLGKAGVGGQVRHIIVRRCVRARSECLAHLVRLIADSSLLPPCFADGADAVSSVARSGSGAERVERDVEEALTEALRASGEVIPVTAFRPQALCLAVFQS